MDFTEVYEITRKAAIAQGITPAQYDEAETWYYDETANVKHLVFENKKVNASENVCFVLGGVQAEDSITDDELHAELGKAPGRELKSTKDLRGSFEKILRKDAFKHTLELVETKGWNIHFIMVQVWYYAFVDIVDSISDNVLLSFPLKAVLYKILKNRPDVTQAVLGKYHYPDIKDKDKIPFLDELISMCNTFVESEPNANDTLMATVLTLLLSKAKSKKELTFIQNETPDKWVKMFVQFYSSEIYSYPNKTLVLDTENQVEKALKEEPIEINGEKMNNFRFDNSATNPMIQVCDYVVSILRKYFVFIDRTLSDVIADIEAFDELQKENYKLLNRTLKKSLENNPLYFHYIASVEMQNNLNNLMEKYC